MVGRHLFKSSRFTHSMCIEDLLAVRALPSFRKQQWTKEPSMYPDRVEVSQMNSFCVQLVNFPPGIQEGREMDLSCKYARNTLEMTCSHISECWGDESLPSRSSKLAREDHVCTYTLQAGCWRDALDTPGTQRWRGCFCLEIELMVLQKNGGN